jgi:streptogramin lyase
MLKSLSKKIIFISVMSFGLVSGISAQDHPWRAVEGWAAMEGDREWGATSAVYPGKNGTMWVGERCGENSCVGSKDDPVLQFDRDGNLVKSFGAGLIDWPHGIHVDFDNNIWITDAACPECSKADRNQGNLGHQIIKFNSDGEVLMTLGQPGVAGNGEYQFNMPSDVLVAPNGDIFVADGHGSQGNNRIVKYDRNGNFIKTWGVTGAEKGEFRDPHALAMDSEGKLYVGDRGNSRIQIFDQEGEWIATWTQFGRPSGLFIDKNDILYSADSESHVPWSGNWGWKRGIRIGSTNDAWVVFFIPDPGQPGLDGSTTAAEGVAVDDDGNIYGAEVGPKQLVKYEHIGWRP